MTKQKWVEVKSAVGRCTLCDDTVGGPGWVQYIKHDGSEKALRLICLTCEREDFDKWDAARRSSQQRNTSRSSPPPKPFPIPQTEVSVPQTPSFQVPLTEVGVTTYKQVVRDNRSQLISHVIETKVDNAEFHRKYKAQHRTPEQWEAALHSYVKWKREKNRRSRGRR